MINIRLLPPPCGESSTDGLYRSADSDQWRVHLAYDLEPGEDDQYPLEDVLDEYLVTLDHVVAQSEESGATDLVLTGECENLRRLIAGIVGHRVHDEEFTLPDGQVAYSLVTTPIE